jgi:hypothetical protein
MEPPIVLIDALRAVYSVSGVKGRIEESAARGIDTFTGTEIPAGVPDNYFASSRNAGRSQAIAACGKGANDGVLISYLSTRIVVEGCRGGAGDVV